MEKIIKEEYKKGDMEYITYRCPICGLTLMKIRNYPGGSCVDYADDCEDFVWHRTHCDPILPSEYSFWCELEKDELEYLAKNAVLITLDNMYYYSLVPRKKVNEEE